MSKAGYDDIAIKLQSQRHDDEEEDVEKSKITITDNYWRMPHSYQHFIDLSLLERNILAIISQFDRGYLGVCFMSNSLFAKHLIVTVRGVQKAIKKLEDLNYISVSRPSIKVRHLRSNVEQKLMEISLKDLSK